MTNDTTTPSQVADEFEKKLNQQLDNDIPPEVLLTTRSESYKTGFEHGAHWAREYGRRESAAELSMRSNSMILHESQTLRARIVGLEAELKSAREEIVSAEYRFTMAEAAMVRLKDELSGLAMKYNKLKQAQPEPRGEESGCMNCDGKLEQCSDGRNEWTYCEKCDESVAYEKQESAQPDREETAAECMQRLGMDGKKWTDEFLKLKPDATDFDTMIGWFCNAIMAGWDHAHWKLQPYQHEPAKSQAVVTSVTKGKPRRYTDDADDLRDDGETTAQTSYGEPAKSPAAGDERPIVVCCQSYAEDNEALEEKLKVAHEIIHSLLTVSRERADDYDLPDNDNYEYWCDKGKEALQKVRK